MIDAISGGSTAGANQPSIADSAQGMGRDTFLQLLVAQVRYQNPLEPTDSTEWLAQTAQFTMVESLEKLSEAQSELLAFQRATLSSNLLGVEITGLDATTGQPVTGVVTGVVFNAGSPRLVVGDHEVDLSSVTEAVRAATTAPTPASTGGGTTATPAAPAGGGTTPTPTPATDEPAAPATGNGPYDTEDDPPQGPTIELVA